MLIISSGVRENERARAKCHMPQTGQHDSRAWEGLDRVGRWVCLRERHNVVGREREVLRQHNLKVSTNRNLEVEAICDNDRVCGTTKRARSLLCMQVRLRASTRKLCMQVDHMIHNKYGRSDPQIEELERFHSNA